jgi:hypothetical protein
VYQKGLGCELLLAREQVASPDDPNRVMAMPGSLREFAGDSMQVFFHIRHKN